ncbi:MAG: DNA repair exonuclease, partial [Clostridia bacterium]|nr:DNA repair exonuclease [Clostridia bacterium]
MNSVKILHCADIHLDAPLTGLPAQLSKMRQEELRQTFGEMVEVANQKNVDIFLISGDLFDQEQVRKTTIDYLVTKLKEISNIPVMIAAGNHDSLSRSYYYNKKIWPENVHIFDKDVGCVDFPELNCCVYGKSFFTPLEEQNGLKGFYVSDESKINIMVMHGEITTAGSQGQYNPITLEDINNSGLDYLALGHVHGFSGINKAGNTYWSYPGTPEAKGFDELGKKGFIMGEVSKGYVELDFIENNKREYFEKEIDVTGFCTYDEIVEKAINAMGENSNQHFYKLILKGDVPEDFNIHTDIVLSRLRDQAFMLKIINKTTFSIQLENDFAEDTLKNVFINH